MDMGCQFFDRSRNTILRQDRSQPVCRERQILMAIMRDLSGISLDEVGRIFRRDHGTVLHAIRLAPGFGAGLDVTDQDYAALRLHVIRTLKLKTNTKPAKP